MDTISKIISLLNERKCDQKDFCAKIGILPSTLSNWKSGISKSYFKYLPVISEYFGVSIDELIKDDPTPEGFVERQKQDEIKLIMSIYDNMTDAKKAEFIYKFNEYINKKRGD